MHKCSFLHQASFRSLDFNLGCLPESAQKEPGACYLRKGQGCAGGLKHAFVTQQTSSPRINLMRRGVAIAMMTVCRHPMQHGAYISWWRRHLGSVLLIIVLRKPWSAQSLWTSAREGLPPTLYTHLMAAVTWVRTCRGAGQSWIGLEGGSLTCPWAPTEEGRSSSISP